MSAYVAPSVFARSRANAASSFSFSGGSAAASSRDTRNWPGTRPSVAHAAAPEAQHFRNSRRDGVMRPPREKMLAPGSGRDRAVSGNSRDGFPYQRAWGGHERRNRGPGASEGLPRGPGRPRGEGTLGHRPRCPAGRAVRPPRTERRRQNDDREDPARPHVRHGRERLAPRKTRRRSGEPPPRGLSARGPPLSRLPHGAPDAVHLRANVGCPVALARTADRGSALSA